MSTKIALAGNPNCGKTTLFNRITGAHRYVGNWPGVTVEKQEAPLKSNTDIIVTDLPGVYSLSPYTPEEKVTSYFLANGNADVVINVVDVNCLERGLFLTTQLLEQGTPTVLALNVMDLFRKSGGKINTRQLSKRLGCPVIEISALKDSGTEELLGTALSLAKSQNPTAKPAVSQIAGGRYNAVTRILAGIYSKNKKGGDNLSRIIDSIVLNKFAAFPVFAVIMAAVYYIAVYSVGGVVSRFIGSGFIQSAINGLGTFLLRQNVPLWLCGLVCRGFIEGVGTVLSFLPQMVALFFLLSLLEECGYMSRVAFIMDRMFRRFGMSGKSAIPLIIGTGCSVPAIMSCRTMENPRERKIAAVTASFIPCGAKMPVIALISAAFFGGKWWFAPLVYFLMLGAVVATAAIFKGLLPAKEASQSFVLELPFYRLPSAESVLRSTFDRTAAFIKKAATVILLAGIAVWFLSDFAVSGGRLRQTDNFSNSLLACFGKAVAPFFAPLGFGRWDAASATVMGLFAKEEIVGVFAALYGSNLSDCFTAASGLSFLLFNLLCIPCVSAVTAIKRQLGSIKLTLFALLYQTVFAYTVSFCTYRFALLAKGGFGRWTAVAIIISVFMLCFIFNAVKPPKASLQLRQSKVNYF